jgi:hypothetical protein
VQGFRSPIRFQNDEGVIVSANQHGLRLEESKKADAKVQPGSGASPCHEKKPERQRAQAHHVQPSLYFTKIVRKSASPQAASNV